MKRTQFLLFALVIALLLALPLVGNNYVLRLATTTLMYAVLAMAWNVVGGFAGYPLFGMAAFFGLGAYSGAVVQSSGYPVPLAWIAAIVIGTAFAVVLGFILLRLRGHAFAIATLVIAEVLRELTNGWTSLTGGGMGLNLPLFGWSPTALAIFFFYAMLALACITLLTTWVVAHSRFGFALNCIRQNEDAANIVGIDTTRYKIIAFTLSGALVRQPARSMHPGSAISNHLMSMTCCFNQADRHGPTRRSGNGNWTRRRRHRLSCTRRTRMAQFSATPHRRAWLPDRRIDPVPAIGLILDRPASSLAQGGLRMTALLELRNVSRSFGGVRAVHNVSLTLQPGQIVGLIGPNGAGKSTLVNIITGVHPASSGEILHKGVPIQRLKPFQISARGIARTFQVVQPFPSMTVVENVMAGAMFAAGITSMQDARRLAMEHLEFTGLAALAEQPAEHLTLANRKRLELAKSLAMNPHVLLLDEVNAGLNTTEVAKALDLIRAIAARGISIVIIEHLLKVVTGLCSRIIVLHHGEMIADDQAADVIRDPRVIEAYLGSRFAERQMVRP